MWRALSGGGGAVAVVVARKATIIALCGALLWSVLAVSAQAQSHRCISTDGRPVVSTGKPAAEPTQVGFALKYRYDFSGVSPTVTVRVTVETNTPTGPPTISHQTVNVGMSGATLTVPRASNLLGMAITINDHSSYWVCRRHAVVTFDGVVQPVPWPPPTTTLPPYTPVDYVQEIIDDAPPRPEPRPMADRHPDDPVRDLYSPDTGLLTPERVKAWRCWAAFGNEAALREAGLLEAGETC